MADFIRVKVSIVVVLHVYNRDITVLVSIGNPAKYRVKVREESYVMSSSTDYVRHVAVLASAEGIVFHAVFGIADVVYCEVDFAVNCPENMKAVMPLKEFLYGFQDRMMVWSGLVWSGLVWSGLVWSIIVRLSSSVKSFLVGIRA